MQLILPLFSSDHTLINNNVGIYNSEGIITYFIGGLPVYSHPETNIQAFRFFISNLIDKGLVKKVEIKNTFHVTIDFVNRACKIYAKEGESGFFKPDNRHGHSFKMVGETLTLAQKLLDEGKSQSEIARQCGVTEGTIRYAIEVGKIKKK